MLRDITSVSYLVYYVINLGVNDAFNAKPSYYRFVVVISEQAYYKASKTHNYTSVGGSIDISMVSFMTAYRGVTSTRSNVPFITSCKIHLNR